MTTRRKFIATAALGATAIACQSTEQTTPTSTVAAAEPNNPFIYCLNTSTVSGQKPGILAYIDLAAEAGYDGIEPWIGDIRSYLEEGGSVSALRQKIDASGLSVEGAIGFAPWLKDAAGMTAMRADMELMASLGGKRIAAPAAGFQAGDTLDPVQAGEAFHQLLDIGEEVGIQPCLEFWGMSPVLSHMSQVLTIAAYANHPKVSFLSDVYHMYRGGSGFETLKMLPGTALELFHMNDYPGDIPREKQQDKDRIYPGDGVAPLTQILSDLKNMGGPKVLSLELFNREYWAQSPALVAKTGLEKMRAAVAKVL